MGTVLFSNTSTIARSVPTAPAIPFLEMVTMEKSFLPAMPVMNWFGLG